MKTRNPPSSYWNFRLLYSPSEGYFFAEVHYHNDIPDSYGNTQTRFETKKSAKWFVRRIWEALFRPLLNGDVTDVNFLKPIK